MQRIFHNEIAWMSNSVPNDHRQLWCEHGGIFQEEPVGATFLLSNDPQDPATLELFSADDPQLGRDRIIFTSNWIAESVNFQKRLNCGKYILSDPQIDGIYLNRKLQISPSDPAPYDYSANAAISANRQLQQKPQQQLKPGSAKHPSGTKNNCNLTPTGTPIEKQKYTHGIRTRGPLYSLDQETSTKEDQTEERSDEDWEFFAQLEQKKKQIQREAQRKEKEQRALRAKKAQEVEKEIERRAHKAEERKREKEQDRENKKKEKRRNP